MTRYLLEIAYKGTVYSGFQLQLNANSVQGEIDKALSILLKMPVVSTGSSRTDAGVHAQQNFMHFEANGPLPLHFGYKMNAILPHDIAVRAIYQISGEMHARFSAQSRSYKYTIYLHKDPFLRDYGYYFPYPLDFGLLEQAASTVCEYTDFTSFSKRNTQVKTFNCQIMHTSWEKMADRYVFQITANRFLRGMVRGLTGTMLGVARGKLNLEEFRQVIEAGDNRRVDFSVPPQGLFLMQVTYPNEMLAQVICDAD